ncbi:hypothetical protein EVAR_89632_1 [Eumeta japonica]|uniref:Uncharacterized protein n=1 Tax=Eumeta variegata TaxID=151549 RepID=A0A4C1TB32_EUMVA|nr:hypothetical protein EVAR_89632_1 [Eumeta japonica]
MPAHIRRVPEFLGGVQNQVSKVEPAIEPCIQPFKSFPALLSSVPDDNLRPRRYPRTMPLRFTGNFEHAAESPTPATTHCQHPLCPMTSQDNLLEILLLLMPGYPSSGTYWPSLGTIKVPENRRLAYVRREPINAWGLPRVKYFKSAPNLGPGKR